MTVHALYMDECITFYVGIKVSPLTQAKLLRAPNIGYPYFNYYFDTKIVYPVVRHKWNYCFSYFLHQSAACTLKMQKIVLLGSSSFSKIFSSDKKERKTFNLVFWIFYFWYTPNKKLSFIMCLISV